MKYYIVTLPMKLTPIACHRLEDKDNGSIKFWLDTSEEDDSNIYGREFATMLVAMYPEGYWSEVNQIDKADYDKYIGEAELLAAKREGGLQ